MEEQYKVIENYLMVKLPKEIDHHETGIISRRADQFIVNGKVKNIVFVFEDTHFMYSSGIGLFMCRYKIFICFGGKVFAINTDRQIKRIINISGLENYIYFVQED